MNAPLLQKVSWDPFLQAGIDVTLCREDLQHLNIPGPKYRRLVAAIEKTKSLGINKILTAGGMHSNHVHALAVFCHQERIPASAFIRGLANRPPNALLQECQALGLELLPLTRTAFDEAGLQGQTPNIEIPEDTYFIPMGVQNEEGILAMQELGEAIAQTNTYDYIALTAGMGTTMRGLLQGIPTAKFIVAAPFKEPNFLLEGLSADEKDRIILKGSNQKQKFGSLPPEAREVASDFQEKTGLWVDNLYMPNLLFHLSNLCFSRYFIPRQKLMLLHCGGAHHNKL